MTAEEEVSQMAASAGPAPGLLAARFSEGELARVLPSTPSSLRGWVGIAEWEEEGMGGK